ncbi:MAG: hypothetical protein K2X41_02640 [Hyphomicrobium sp.]|nr:hypothetical protein [Hyphomicrobium sp.]
MPSKLCRDGKKIDEYKRKDNKLGDLMPALFLRHFDQQKGALTLPMSIAATNRSRYISKGDPQEIVDRSRYISIDAESYFLGSDEIDGKSDGKNAARRTNF